MNKPAAYAILLMLPIILSLAAGEIMVRVLAPQNMTGTWLTYGPRGLVLNQADWTVRHQFGHRDVRYSFNAHHQRSAARDPSSLPVLVLGDSFTFGWLLGDQDTYVAHLQRRTDAAFGAGRAQLLNAAVGGWGAGDQLAYLEEIADALSPRLVVVFVSIDDFARAQRWPLYVLDDHGGLVANDLSDRTSRLKRMLNAIPAYPWLLEHSHLVQLLRNLVLSPPPPPPQEAQAVAATKAAAAAAVQTSDRSDQRDLARALYARIKAWCDARGAELLVVTTGWPGASYPWLEAEMAQLDIDFVELGPDLGHPIEAYQIPEDGHANEKGAALIAEAAWPELNRRLVPLLAR